MEIGWKKYHILLKQLPVTLAVAGEGAVDKLRQYLWLLVHPRSPNMYLQFRFLSLHLYTHLHTHSGQLFYICERQLKFMFKT